MSSNNFNVGSDFYISYLDVFNNEKIFDNNLLLCNVLTNQNRVDKHDLLITLSSETANEVGISSVYLGDKNPYLNSFCFGLRPKTKITNSIYVNFLLSSNKYRLIISKIAQGSTRFNLSKKHFLSIKIWIPSLQEQQKIAKFFSLLDKQIALWERKLELYLLFYKYYLRTLLPKYLNKIWLKPRLRFSFFKKNIYESFLTKEIFTITRGNVLSKNKVSLYKNKNFQYPVYSSQTENNGIMGYYSEYLFENSITWTTDGAKAGTFNYREGKFYSTNVSGILIKKTFKPNNYFAELYNSISYKFVSRELGNPKLMNNIVENIIIKIPSQEEINMIDEFIKKYKYFFILLKKKIENYKKIKDFYLKKIFI